MRRGSVIVLPSSHRAASGGHRPSFFRHFQDGSVVVVQTGDGVVVAVTVSQKIVGDGDSHILNRG